VDLNNNGYGVGDRGNGIEDGISELVREWEASGRRSSDGGPNIHYFKCFVEVI
jgi:hypothetical protein